MTTLIYSRHYDIFYFTGCSPNINNLSLIPPHDPLTFFTTKYGPSPLVPFTKGNIIGCMGGLRGSLDTPPPGYFYMIFDLFFLTLGSYLIFLVTKIIVALYRKSC